jgi:hypothetical protein
MLGKNSMLKNGDRNGTFDAIVSLPLFIKVKKICIYINIFLYSTGPVE